MTHEEEQAYLNAILHGEPVEVIDKPIDLKLEDFTPPPGMKGYADSNFNQQFWGKLKISCDEDWDQLQVEKDMKAELDRLFREEEYWKGEDWHRKNRHRYRSIDEPWEVT